MAERCEPLPTELWEVILDLLDSNDCDMKPLSLLCKDVLSVTNRKRRGLKVAKSNITVTEFSKLLQRFRYLKAIDVSRIEKELDGIINEIAQSGLNLEELDISTHKKIPWNGLRNMKSLTVLKCSECFLDDTHLSAIASYLPWLQELDISKNPKVTDAGMTEVSTKLKFLRNIDLSGNSGISYRSLVSLSKKCVLLAQVSFMNCSSDCLIGTCYLLVDCRNLISLKVGGYHDNRHEAMLILGKTIHFAESLHALEFSNMKISDNFLSNIAIASVPLRKFVLSNCRDFSHVGLSSMLREYPLLEELNLENTDFLTDEHVSVLSQLVPCLTNINLKRCSNLTSSTLYTLVKNCPKLQEINMMFTSLGKQGNFDNVDLDLVKNHNIKFLFTSSNVFLNDELLRKFVLICPNLKILEFSTSPGIPLQDTKETLKSFFFFLVKTLKSFCSKVLDICTERN